jgi:hypothetical protein
VTNISIEVNNVPPVVVASRRGFWIIEGLKAYSIFLSPDT